MSKRRSTLSSGSYGGRGHARAFQESYRAFLKSLRAALHSFSSPKSPRSSAMAQAALAADPMDIDHISPNPAHPISQLAGTLPKCQISENIDPVPIAQATLLRLRMMDASLLTKDTLWRDIFALTGTTRTFSGAETVHSTWKTLTSLHEPYDFQIAPQGGVMVMRPMPTLSWIQVKFMFKTRASPNLTCMAIMRLIPGEADDWKIWVLTTILQGIDGFPNVDTLEPTIAKELKRPITPVSDNGEPEEQNCVIVGAGMAGLCLAGYMKAVGCPAIVLEKKESIGQQWQERYDSVSIHTSRACGQMPFENVWGPEYPYHLGAKDVVEGYAKWVKKYLPNEIWLSTELTKAYWNKTDKNWRLDIQQNGVRREIKTKHLVFALGLCTRINEPQFANREAFKGIVLHGSQYKNAKAWGGLRGVIIGTANTGHDCADDMLKAGVSSVTMVQRNPTAVLPVEYYSKIYDRFYNDETPAHVSDAMMISTPNAITRLTAIGAIKKMMSEDPARFEALEKQGFKVVHNLDLYHLLLERFGGHYIDVGVSKKIADGQIKVKSGAAVTGFTETGLSFSDGSTLDADVVVLATGYEGNMRLLAAPLLEPEVASKLHDYWGVDDEGEIRGAWKPIGHPNVWYTGGNVLYMRYFAKFLAMSIAADCKGIPLPMYEKKY